MSELAGDVDVTARADRLIEDLREAHDALERARRRVAAVGEADLERLADADEELTALFDRYEEQVTGDGDFQTFIEFQGKIAAFTEELPEEIRNHGVFEDVDDLLQQRRLTESDWERVRSTLAPVREDVARLDERESARERYRDARHAVRREMRDIDDRIADLERLVRLGDADLDAPTDRLREPIETYNETVSAAFSSYKRNASAREVLSFVEATDAFPLVPFEAPPEDLRAFVRDHEAGAEPIPQLLEYADYSRSKLSHYVNDADALKRNVATQRTYLRRLDADPLTVDWPPPNTGTLRFRCRELTSVVARFADDADSGEGALRAIRGVRALPRETDYPRLRDSATARERLSDAERHRLASGAVDDALTAAREARARLEDALDAHENL